MTAPQSDSRLTIRIDTPLPERLAAERSNVLFVSGACYAEGRTAVSLALASGGRQTPAIAHSMPRPDLAASAGTSAYRSGFWVIVPVPAAKRPLTIALELVVELDDGARMRRRIGSIKLAPAVSPAPRRAGRTRLRSEPRIAICMATYDPPLLLLERQIKSIREQTNKSWICLISDDGSSPEKLAALEDLLAGDSRFVLARGRRRLGFFHNFERALRLAPAGVEFIALADQDDRWEAEKLDVLADRIGPAAVAYSDARIVTEDGELLSETYWNRRRNNSSNFTSLLLANTVSGSAALFRRHVVERSLPFPPAFGRFFHDHWLALVGAALGEIAYVDRPLYDYVQHDDALLGHERAHAWADKGRGVPARLGHFREDPSYFYEHWRTTYFQEYCRLVVIARLLLARCGTELTEPRRRMLQGLAEAERSPAAIAWLAVRQSRRLAGYDETLGAEGRLLRAFAWRRLLEAQPPKPSAAHRWLPRQSAFPVDRAGVMATPQSRTPVAAPATRPEARTR